MKKFLMLLLAIGLIFALAACASAEEPPEPTSEEVPTIAEEPPQQEEPLSPIEEEISPIAEEPPPQDEPLSTENPVETESAEEPDCESTEYEGSDALRCILLYSLVIDRNVDTEALGLTIIRLEYGEGPGPLGDVTFMHMLDYDELRGSGDFEHTDTLMIQAAVPMRDFAVINMTNDAAGDQIVFIPDESFGLVENFLPGEAYIITSYIGVGTWPWSGITFLDDSGQRWYFAILQNQADEGDPYLLLPMVRHTG